MIAPSRVSPTCDSKEKEREKDYVFLIKQYLQIVLQRGKLIALFFYYIFKLYVLETVTLFYTIYYYI